jgi:hypothetical protein
MKNIIFFIFIAAIFNISIAEVPQSFNYQAAVRDNSGAPISYKSISIRISIVQGNIYGQSIYIETHKTTTNQVGLVNLQIGAGTIITGVFKEINWGNGPYYLKVDWDTDGGSNFKELGIPQIISVPYSLYSNYAEKILWENIESKPPIFSGLYNDLINKPISGNGIKIDKDSIISLFIDGQTKGDIICFDGTSWILLPIGKEGNYLKTINGIPAWIDDTDTLIHYTGEIWGGGIVFYVWDNGKHGLIASLNDIDDGTGIGWGDRNINITAGNGAISTDNGLANTEAITFQLTDLLFAAKLCNDYNNGFSDWYLPSILELELLFKNIFLINTILNNDNDNQTKGLFIDNYLSENRYWSSTEYDSPGPQNAFSYGKKSNEVEYSISDKSTKLRVRAVRRF